MFPIRHSVLALALIAFSTALSLGADPPAMKVLKEKGLTRSGRLFVIDAENTVLEKWKETRAVLADHAATAGRKSEADLAARGLAGLEERRVELQQGLDDLNQRINEQGFSTVTGRPGGFGQGAYVRQLIAQRDMIRMNLTEVSAAQRSLKADPGPDPKALEAESQKRLEAAKAALTGLRASVDEAMKRYDELGSDASVRSALQALEKEKLGSFKLGPSPAFKAAVRALENAERTILAKRTAAVSRKKARARR
jgi:hypothetical protein